MYTHACTCKAHKHIHTPTLTHTYALTLIYTHTTQRHKDTHSGLHIHRVLFGSLIDFALRDTMKGLDSTLHSILLLSSQLSSLDMEERPFFP